MDPRAEGSANAGAALSSLITKAAPQIGVGQSRNSKISRFRIKECTKISRLGTEIVRLTEEYDIITSKTRPFFHLMMSYSSVNRTISVPKRLIFAQISFGGRWRSVLRIPTVTKSNLRNGLITHNPNPSPTTHHYSPLTITHHPSPSTHHPSLLTTNHHPSPTTHHPPPTTSHH